MAFEQNTLGELLSNPKIKQIAKDAIRNRDLSQEDLWNKTLAQIKDEYIFFGEIGNGFRCLYRAADSGDWYYPLYSEAECAEDEARRGVNIIRLSSEDPKADERPFIFLVPGGGFMNVWSLTEGRFCPSFEADQGKGRTIPCTGGQVYYLWILCRRIPDLSVEYKDGISGLRTADAAGLLPGLRGNEH